MSSAASPNYQQLYESSRLNVRLFMNQVEQYIEEVLQKHAKEIQTLKKQNKMLKNKLKLTKAIQGENQQEREISKGDTRTQSVAQFGCDTKQGECSTNYANTNRNSMPDLQSGFSSKGDQAWRSMLDGSFVTNVSKDDSKRVPLGDLYTNEVKTLRNTFKSRVGGDSYKSQLSSSVKSPQLQSASFKTMPDEGHKSRNSIEEFGNSKRVSVVSSMEKPSLSDARKNKPFSHGSSRSRDEINELLKQMREGTGNKVKPFQLSEPVFTQKDFSSKVKRMM